MAGNGVCIACGREYEICSNCPSEVRYIPWRRLYCSMECFKAFETARAYNNGEIDAEEAKENFSNLGLNYDSFDTATGEIARDLLVEPKKRNK